MLKKGLSVILVLLLVIGTVAVLPVAAASEKADDVPSSEEQGAQFVEPNEDIEAELDAADAEWEREHGELAGTGADVDKADEGLNRNNIAETGETKYEVKRFTIDIKVGETQKLLPPQKSYFYSDRQSLTYLSGDKDAVEYDRYYSNDLGKYGIFLKGKHQGTVRLKYEIHQYTYDYSYLIPDVTYETIYTINVAPSSDSSLASPKITGCESLDSGVKINWNAVSGAARYRVYYYGSNGWTKMGSTTSTSFIDSDVRSGGNYTYTVRCVNAADTAFTSDFDHSGYNYTYNMATPKITGLSSSSAGVKITWGKVTNASRYRVYYKNSSGGWTNMKETTGTTYTDDDVRYGGTYTYTVRCVNSSGRFTSDFNGNGWTYTHYLSTPKITGCESLSNGVNIKWNAISGAQKYRVYYKNSKGGWTKMGETSGTSFVDDDVRSGYPYTYTVRCINNSLDRFMSDCDTNGYRYTYNPSFATPHITSCETVSNGIKISWGAVPGVKRYALYYLSANDGWRRMKETTSTSFIDTDVRYGNPYTYTVRCLTDNGKDFASGYDSAGYKAFYYSMPKILEVGIYEGDLFVDIECTHDDLVSYYKVWYQYNSQWYYVGKTKNGWIYYPNYNFNTGSTYTFTVQGYDSSDNSITSYNENGYRMYVWDY